MALESLLKARIAKTIKAKGYRDWSLEDILGKFDVKKEDLSEDEYQDLVRRYEARFEEAPPKRKKRVRTKAQPDTTGQEAGGEPSTEQGGPEPFPKEAETEPEGDPAPIREDSPQPSPAAETPPAAALTREELNQAIKECIDSGQCEVLNSMQAQLKDLGGVAGQLEALQETIKNIPAGSSVDLSSVQEQLGTIRDQVDQLSEKTESIPQSLTSDLDQTMQQVITQLANMRHESLQSDKQIADALHGLTQREESQPEGGVKQGTRTPEGPPAEEPPAAEAETPEEEQPAATGAESQDMAATLNEILRVLKEERRPRAEQPEEPEKPEKKKEEKGGGLITFPDRYGFEKEEAEAETA